MLARLLWAALAAAGLALAGGFGGAIHPLGDSLAVFRLPVAAATVAVAILLVLVVRRGKLAAATFALAAAAAAAPAALSYLPAEGALNRPLHAIYQKNLRFTLADPAAIVEDILSSGADIVTLQEVNERNRKVLDLLREAYPGQAHCPFAVVGGPAVLSRWPATGSEPVCTDGSGMVALQVETPQGPIWIASIHLHWPWPHVQAAQVERLLPVIAGLDGPVVIAGDFNMVPWGTSVRRIATVAGAAKAGPTVTTLPMLGGLMPLAIDHVLLPRGWRGTQEVRPRLGSDHRGLLVRFSR